MESRKRQVDLDLEEVEKKRKAHRDYKIIKRQFQPLMGKIEEWIEQLRDGEDQDDSEASVDDGDSHEQAPPDEGLAGMIQRFQRELDENEGNEASGSSQVIDENREVSESDEASGSGQDSGQNSEAYGSSEESSGSSQGSTTAISLIDPKPKQKGQTTN
ncbi:hypothetical protein ACP4OV_009907 [Aristida adscensionis]